MEMGVYKMATFTWDSLTAHVDSFHLELSSDMNFSNMYYSATIMGGDTSYMLTVDTLQYDSMYYWRMVSFDSLAIYQTTSDVWSFTVKGDPRIANLKTPANQEMHVRKMPTFTWDTLAISIDSLHIDLSRHMDFSDTFYSETIVGRDSMFKMMVDTLEYDSVYYWRVISFSDSGITQFSSHVWSFTTQGHPPAQVVLASPASASIDVSIRPTLSWNTANYADEYHVHVSTFNNFSDTAYYGIVSAPSTSVTLNVDLETYKVYYWRVAGNNIDEMGPWSLFFNFTTLYTGLNTPNANFGANAYPNPATDYMLISFEGQGTNGSVKIYDMQGKEIKTLSEGYFDLGNQSVKLDRAGFNGMYFVRIEQNGAIQTLKVVFK